MDTPSVPPSRTKKQTGKHERMRKADTNTSSLAEWRLKLYKLAPMVVPMLLPR